MELFHGEERASACIVCRLPDAVKDLHPFVLLRVCGREVLGIWNDTVTRTDFGTLLSLSLKKQLSRCN